MITRKEFIRWPSDKVRADMSVWNAWTDAMAKEKLNMAVIDLGEALVYPSHPELAAKGAFTPEKMQAEIRRLRALGIEAVPKLNFSGGHNRWLNEYRAMMGTGTGEGERLLKRFIDDYPRKQLLGFLLCSWARPVPYHKTKGLKSIEFFGDMKRRWETVNPG